MDNNFLSRHGAATELGLRKAIDSLFDEIEDLQSRFQTPEPLQKVRISELKSEMVELQAALSELVEYKEWNGYTGDDWQFQTEDGIQNQRENN